MNEANADGRRPDRAAFGIAVGLAAIGAVVVVDSYRIPDKPGYSGVGAGDVPWIVGVVLICLAAATVVSGLRGGFAEMPRQRLGPVAWILGGLLVQLFTIHTVGFILATGVLFACAAAGFGERRFHISLPLGLGLALVVFAVFDGFLKLSLPTGPLERLISGG